MRLQLSPDFSERRTGMQSSPTAVAGPGWLLRAAVRLIWDMQHTHEFALCLTSLFQKGLAWLQGQGGLQPLLRFASVSDSLEFS